jgi:hypothetical protein
MRDKRDKDQENSDARMTWSEQALYATICAVPAFGPILVMLSARSCGRPATGKAAPRPQVLGDSAESKPRTVNVRKVTEHKDEEENAETTSTSSSGRSAQENASGTSQTATDVQAVPEPSVSVLFAMGLLGLLHARRKRR